MQPTLETRTRFECALVWAADLNRYAFLTSN